MRTTLKLAAALTFAGALAAVAVTQSQAASYPRDAATQANRGYAYDPASGANAYDAAPFGDAYAPGRENILRNRLPAGTSPNDCVGDLGYGRPDYGAC
jgi:hypothetical protein